MLVIFTKLSFTVFNVRCFLLLSYFLVVKDYDLSQRTSRLLSVLLTLEYVTILSWPISFFFYISCLLNDVLCKNAQMFSVRFFVQCFKAEIKFEFD